MEQTVAGISRHHAGVRPDHVALVSGARRTTYGELDRRASRVAQGLLADRLAPHARVAVLDKNSDAFFEILFGAAKARVALVAVNWRLAPPEVAYVLNDAATEILFVGPEFFSVIAKIRGELRTVRRIVALTEGAPGVPAPPESGQWERYAAWRDRQADHDPLLPVAPDDVALQMYTSGTTGRPKGAQITHANLLSHFPVATREWGRRWIPDDVVLVCMPIFHIGGSGWALVGFYAGARIVVVREVLPAEILRAIPAERVTKALFVPAVMQLLLQNPACAETDFSSLDLILYGASPIPLDLLRASLATFRCQLGQGYGLTETTGAITYLPPADHTPEGSPRMRSCGRALATAEIRIVARDGTPLPPGEVGEVVCRSPQVTKGYWNLPEETADALRGGWFHTGDAGYLDADGYLYIHDRVKDMIVSGGENVYPAEVENALFGHPAVADVAVIGVPDSRWGEAVKAVVVRQAGIDVTPEELMAFARQHIAGYKVPKSVDFVDALPRNPSGKVLKRVLRAPYWEGRDREVS
jgi:acyl-CoA synthetase (AMP-forming)/AMP-acid ligase II